MKLLGRVAVLLGIAATMPAGAATEEEHAARRRAMVAEVGARIPGAPSGFAPQVLDALGKVPRHRFVPAAAQPYAYENRPLSIGHRQTISQPYIVALMTDLLKVEKHHRVLEVGTGSGYQAAVLALLAAHVYTIEIVEPLGLEARERLAALGYANVSVRIGDGYAGWEEHAPYDAIMVTAGAAEVPQPLLRQLKPGGRMVIPVGPAQSVQSLTLIEKGPGGALRRSDIIPVRFVPFTRSP